MIFSALETPNLKYMLLKQLKCMILFASLGVRCRHQQLHKTLLPSETTLLISTKLCMNVSWGILYRTDVGIFDLLKNMATVAKNRT